MANAKNAKATIPVQMRIGNPSPVITPYWATFDTTASDLDIHAPASNRYAGIVGLYYKEAGNHTFTIKSGGNTIFAIENPSSGQVFWPLSRLPHVLGLRGETLSLRFDTAVANTVLLYVMEFDLLDFYP